jgi:exosortase H (IPTLxxWG-CTERM-specific)
MTERKRSKIKNRRLKVPGPAAKQAVASGCSTPPAMILFERFRFATAFAILCVALYAVILVLPPSVTKPLNEHTARMLGLILTELGIPVTTANDTVSGGGLAFRIIPECTPLFTAALFLSFMAFYPATVREKASGILMGIPALYLGNLGRLAATFMISRYDRRLFEAAHVYLGQVFTIFLVILVSIAWLKRLDRNEPEQGIPLKAAGFLFRFTLISGCLFLVWIKVHYWYIWILDRFMLFGFSLFGYRVELARHTAFYYETFSLVVFTSLVLSARSLPSTVRIRVLAGGLGLIFFSHIFHRIDNALIACFTMTDLLTVDLTLLAAVQYLLPVLLLIFLFHYQKKRKPRLP